jgi:hypothetical protein
MGDRDNHTEKATALAAALKLFPAISPAFMCWYLGNCMESQPATVLSTHRLRVHRVPLFRVRASAFIRARNL